LAGRRHLKYRSCPAEVLVYVSLLRYTIDPDVSNVTH
jgi:hypothetical protein